MTLYNKLEAYSQSDYYGFHMPGHKRNPKMPGGKIPYQLDITEIDGFDDLHHAAGILKEAQDRAAAVYYADETHFLINGSTTGILSAIHGVTHKGDTILVARNCHKSVYHAIYMNELKPVYLYPDYQSEVQLNTEVSAEDVRKILSENSRIRAVVIVSPTYDGVVSDVEAIACAVHEKGLPLIVDEAHGAHFGFHPYFPNRANIQGADLVINSLHKTMPSLTQTALLHINGDLVDREKIRRYLHMLQSSSPSYILMASIDSCIHLMEEQGEALFVSYVERLEQVRAGLQKLRCLKLIETEHYDRSKILISVAGTDMTSHELTGILREQYHLEMEMTAGRYVLAMTSVGDTREGMERLVQALMEIDDKIYLRLTTDDKSANINMLHNSQEKGISETRLPEDEIVHTCAEALEIFDSSQTMSLPWQQAVGYISAEYAYLYPPGCPLLVPGERVSQEAADMLQWYREQEFDIEGLKKDLHIEVY